MLENEPEGGERTGSQPAGDTADTPSSRRATAAARAAPSGRRPASGPADAGPPR